MFETSVSEELSQSVDRKKLEAMLLGELSHDSRLRIVPVKGLPSTSLRPGASAEERIDAARGKGISPDVWVFPAVFLSDAVGTSGGKLVSMKAFTVRGEVISAYGTGTSQAEDKGPLFENEQVVRNTAAKTRSVVLGQLGPNLPSREAVAGLQKARMQKKVATIEEQAGILPEDDAQTRLRKILEAAKNGPKPAPQAAAQE